MLTEEARRQVYDNVIKRWFERHVKEMLPFLLEERDLTSEEDKNALRQKVCALGDGPYEVEEMNIEALIPPRRNDRIYRSPYRNQMHMVDIEIETSPNGLMAVRSLVYHSLLMDKYSNPIISMILYPFKMPIVKSPLEDTNGDGPSIAFRFRTLPLWRFDAFRYFERRILCMYALLPAMGGATQDMLFQALDIMVEYYREQQDENGLREELLVFSVMLRRAAILSPADIEEVTQKMLHYDPFLREDPHFGAMLDDAEAKGKVEGKIEGKAETLASLQSTLLRQVEGRFPTLTAYSEKIHWPENAEALGLLMMNVAAAPDEWTVRRLLGLPAD